MNAITQYEDYISWLTTKYHEVAVERALFWQGARPYRIDWTLARKYGEMIRFISAELDAARAGLEIERRKASRGMRFAAIRAYLNRLSCRFAHKSSAPQR